MDEDHRWGAVGEPPGPRRLHPPGQSRLRDIIAVPPHCPTAFRDFPSITPRSGVSGTCLFHTSALCPSDRCLDFPPSQPGRVALDEHLPGSVVGVMQRELGLLPKGLRRKGQGNLSQMERTLSNAGEVLLAEPPTVPLTNGSLFAFLEVRPGRVVPVRRILKPPIESITDPPRVTHLPPPPVPSSRSGSPGKRDRSHAMW